MRTPATISVKHWLLRVLAEATEPVYFEDLVGRFMVDTGATQADCRRRNSWIRDKASAAVQQHLGELVAHELARLLADRHYTDRGDQFKITGRGDQFKLTLDGYLTLDWMERSPT